MAGDSNSKEGNYWPGFVDALTNVVLVMVFIVVVFCAVIISSILKSTSAKFSQVFEAKNEVIKNLEAEISSLKASSQSNQVQSKPINDSGMVCEIISYGDEGEIAKKQEIEPPIIVYGSNNKIDISYSLGVVNPEEKIWNDIKAALKIDGDGSDYMISMVASSSESSPTEGRRLSYYRLGILRDFFVSIGVKPQNIEFKINDDVLNEKRSHVLITLKKVNSKKKGSASNQ